MDWITFGSKAIESLAWPVAAVALVALLRDEIAKLAPSLKKLKAGPLEAEFEREVKQLKEIKDSRPAPGEAAPIQSRDTASKSFLFEVAELHPRSAILESWVRLEAAARAVLVGKRDAKSSYLQAPRLAEPLAQLSILNPSQVTMFHELRRLRNEVAHGNFEPTQESARSYIDLAAFLQGHLEGQV
ncbi:DUF4145 domain-containing protein [Lysobacter antibioticus]|uniref:DUF4145 domain-containing protein n=1 Tax=Lysobacter antibioticus TaxID=84531 RepID=UPI0011E06215|nr:hypothetical protein [Lysobacter antibioticus]